MAMRLIYLQSVCLRSVCHRLFLSPFGQIRRDAYFPRWGERSRRVNLLR